MRRLLYYFCRNIYRNLIVKGVGYYLSYIYIFVLEEKVSPLKDLSMIIHYLHFTLKKNIVEFLATKRTDTHVVVVDVVVAVK